MLPYNGTLLFHSLYHDFKKNDLSSPFLDTETTVHVIETYSHISMQSFCSNSSDPILSFKKTRSWRELQPNRKNNNIN